MELDEVMRNLNKYLYDIETQTKSSLSMIRGRATSIQKRRFRRDLVIYVAHRGRVSQRILAEVFDLARSRVGEIIRMQSALDAKPKWGCRNAPLFVMPVLIPGANKIQRRRQLRDLVIGIAHKGRISQ